MRKLELFYDIVSPYSYFAFECLERYRARWQIDLVLRPAFLGGVIMNYLGYEGVTGFDLWSLLVAVVGAVVLLFVVGLVRR